MFGTFSQEALNKTEELLYGEGPTLKWKVEDDGTVVPAKPASTPKAPPKGEVPDAANAAVGNAQRNKTNQKKGLAAAALKQTNAGGASGVQSQMSRLNAGA